MSPIIYTPHGCNKPVHDLFAGTLYQCPECDRVWEADRIPSVSKRGGECVWYLVEDPRHDAALRAASTRAAHPVTPATPRATPDMVQLVIDTYTDHTTVVPGDGAEPLGWCGECETGIYGPHTIQAHAREKAVEALQNALRGETRE